MKKLAIIIIVFGSILALKANTACALTSTKPTGIVISPAFEQVNLDPGEPSHNLSFTLTNNEPTTETVSLSTADFNTLDESGGLYFMGTKPSELEQRYGLASWLSLPSKVVAIAPEQTVEIKASIVNSPSLAAGGHYGAIMINISTSSSQTSENVVALQPVASLLLFVTKLGGDTHKLKLLDVNFRHSLIQMSSVVTLNFRNTGNSHLIPRGDISIFDPHGNLVSIGVVNENSNILLPAHERLYPSALRQITLPKWPGHYKLMIRFTFDGFTSQRIYQTSFLYLPSFWPVVGVVGVIVIIVIIRWRRHSQSKAD